MANSRQNSEYSFSTLLKLLILLVSLQSVRAETNTTSLTLFDKYPYIIVPTEITIGFLCLFSLGALAIRKIYSDREKYSRFTPEFYTNVQPRKEITNDEIKTPRPTIESKSPRTPRDAFGATIEREGFGSVLSPPSANTTKTIDTVSTVAADNSQPTPVAPFPALKIVITQSPR
ncbi:hypothetical protein AYO45_03165 [Gammaproteobacteria bacterium SCGC AG-212-F23]|nr:hypothetical protein AYO45_03165 [Gammaproteobacteria bacterium SCGC AG-212-F23]